MSENIKNVQQDQSATDGKESKMAFSLANIEEGPAPQQNTPNTAINREGKYLTFSLEDEEYGIVILKIKEIIGLMPITAVPRTPDYVKGVINLRGKVIPVIDLRLRFGIAEKDYTDRTCIVVVEIGGRSMEMIIGVVVDSVSEVLNIKNEDIEDTPAFGTALNTEYILGMAKVEGGVKILLDIDTVLSSEEIASLKDAA